MLLEANTVLAAEDLTVELGGLPVLRGVTISVRAGEAVALLGGNGSGKSTLVRTLLGLLPHERGTVRLFGTPLRDFVGLVAHRLRPTALTGAAQRVEGQRDRRGRTAGTQKALPPIVPSRSRRRPQRHCSGWAL